MTYKTVWHIVSKGEDGNPGRLWEVESDSGRLYSLGSLPTGCNNPADSVLIQTENSYQFIVVNNVFGDAFDSSSTDKVDFWNINLHNPSDTSGDYGKLGDGPSGLSSVTGIDYDGINLYVVSSKDASLWGIDLDNTTSSIVGLYGKIGEFYEDEAFDDEENSSTKPTPVGITYDEENERWLSVDQFTRNIFRFNNTVPADHNEDYVIIGQLPSDLKNPTGIGTYGDVCIVPSYSSSGDAFAGTDTRTASIWNVNLSDPDDESGDYGKIADIDGLEVPDGITGFPVYDLEKVISGSGNQANSNERWWSYSTSAFPDGLVPSGQTSFLRQINIHNNIGPQDSDGNQLELRVWIAESGTVFNDLAAEWENSGNWALVFYQGSNTLALAGPNNPSNAETDDSSIYSFTPRTDLISDAKDFFFSDISLSSNLNIVFRVRDYTAEAISVTPSEVQSGNLSSSASLSIKDIPNTQQEASLGSNPFFFGVWSGSILIDPAFVVGGGPAYLKNIGYDDFSSGGFIFEISSLADGLSTEVFDPGPELTVKWETYVEAVTLTDSDGDSIVIAGPSHSSVQTSDSDEPYAWVPSNYDAVRDWIDAVEAEGASESVTVKIADGPPTVSIEPSESETTNLNSSLDLSIGDASTELNPSDSTTGNIDSSLDISVQTASPVSVNPGSSETSDLSSSLNLNVNNATSVSIDTNAVTNNLSSSLSLSVVTGVTVTPSSSTTGNLGMTVSGVSTMRLTPISVNPSDVETGNLSSSLSIAAQNLQPSSINPTDVQTSDLSSSLNLGVETNRVLELSDFDRTGLDIDVIMLIESGTSSNSIIYRSSAWRSSSAIGSLVGEGNDERISPSNSIVGRLWRTSNSNFRVNIDGIAGGLGNYLNTTPGSYYNFYFQILNNNGDLETASFNASSQLGSRGGSYANFALPVSTQNILNQLQVGTRFIFAVARSFSPIEPRSAITESLSSSLDLSVISPPSTKPSNPSDVSTDNLSSSLELKVQAASATVINSSDVATSSLNGSLSLTIVSANEINPADVETDALESSLDLDVENAESVDSNPLDTQSTDLSSSLAITVVSAEVDVNPSDVETDNLSSSLQLTVISPQSILPNDSQSSNLESSLDLNVENAGAELADPSDSETSDLSSSLDLSVEDVILVLDDFDDTGLEIEMLALVQAGGNPVFFETANWGSSTDVIGSLLDGELGISPGNTLIERIRFSSGNNNLILNDSDAPQPLTLSSYFGTGGMGRDLIFFFQTLDHGLLQAPISEIHAGAGGGFLNLRIPESYRSTFTGTDSLSSGDRFIIGFARQTSAELNPSDAQTNDLSSSLNVTPVDQIVDIDPNEVQTEDLSSSLDISIVSPVTVTPNESATNALASSLEINLENAIAIDADPLDSSTSNLDSSLSLVIVNASEIDPSETSSSDLSSSLSLTAITSEPIDINPVQVSTNNLSSTLSLTPTDIIVEVNPSDSTTSDLSSSLNLTIVSPLGINPGDSQSDSLSSSISLDIQNADASSINPSDVSTSDIDSALTLGIIDQIVNVDPEDVTTDNLSSSLNLATVSESPVNPSDVQTSELDSSLSIIATSESPNVVEPSEAQSSDISSSLNLVIVNPLGINPSDSQTTELVSSLSLDVQNATAIEVDPLNGASDNLTSSLSLTIISAESVNPGDVLTSDLLSSVSLNVQDATAIESNPSDAQTDNLSSSLNLDVRSQIVDADPSDSESSDLSSTLSLTIISAQSINPEDVTTSNIEGSLELSTQNAVAIDADASDVSTNDLSSSLSLAIVSPVSINPSDSQTSEVSSSLNLNAENASAINSNPQASSTDDLSSSLLLTIISANEIDPSELQTSNLDSSLDVGVQDSVAEEVTLNESQTSNLESSLSLNVQNRVLELSDFDEENLDIDLLGIIEVGNLFLGIETIYYRTSERGSVIGSLVSGELGFGDENTLITRIVWSNSSNRLLINDNDSPSSLSLSDYFIGDGSQVLFLETLEHGRVEIPITQEILGPVGSNFANFNIPSEHRSMFAEQGGLDEGDRLIIAFASYGEVGISPSSASTSDLSSSVDLSVVSPLNIDTSEASTSSLSSSLNVGTGNAVSTAVNPSDVETSSLASSLSISIGDRDVQITPTDSSTSSLSSDLTIIPADASGISVNPEALTSNLNSSLNLAIENAQASSSNPTDSSTSSLSSSISLEIAGATSVDLESGASTDNLQSSLILEARNLEIVEINQEVNSFSTGSLISPEISEPGISRVDGPTIINLIPTDGSTGTLESPIEPDISTVLFNMSDFYQKNLNKFIPKVVRDIDEDGQFQQFLDVIAPEMDEIVDQVNNLLTYHDVTYIPRERLVYLASYLGIVLDEIDSEFEQRGIINNSPVILEAKGTLKSVQAYLSSLSVSVEFSRVSDDKPANHVNALLVSANPTDPLNLNEEVSSALVRRINRFAPINLVIETIGLRNEEINDNLEFDDSNFTIDEDGILSDEPDRFSFRLMFTRFKGLFTRSSMFKDPYTRGTSAATPSDTLFRHGDQDVLEIEEKGVDEDGNAVDNTKSY